MFSRNKTKVEEKTVVKGKHTRLDEDEEIEESESSDAAESDEDEEQEASEEDENTLQSGLKQELNKMSFEDVQKLQNKIGLKK